MSPDGLAKLCSVSLRVANIILWYNPAILCLALLRRKVCITLVQSKFNQAKRTIIPFFWLMDTATRSVHVLCIHKLYSFMQHGHFLYYRYKWTSSRTRIYFLLYFLWTKWYRMRSRITFCIVVKYYLSTVSFSWNKKLIQKLRKILISILPHTYFHMSALNWHAEWHKNIYFFIVLLLRNTEENERAKQIATNTFYYE